MYFLTVASKQKNNKNEARNTIASSYHSKVRSTQEKGILFFSCLGYGV